jgi:hypothetical protein
LILELPLEADRAHLIRSWAGHIVAGTAEAAETEQFRQFSRSLPDGKKRKKPRTLSALKSQFPIDTPAKPTQRGESRKNQGCTLLAKGAISVL